MARELSRQIGFVAGNGGLGWQMEWTGLYPFLPLDSCAHKRQQGLTGDISYTCYSLVVGTDLLDEVM